MHTAVLALSKSFPEQIRNKMKSNKEIENKIFVSCGEATKFRVGWYRFCFCERGPPISRVGLGSVGTGNKKKIIKWPKIVHLVFCTRNNMV